MPRSRIKYRYAIRKARRMFGSRQVQALADLVFLFPRLLPSDPENDPDPYGDGQTTMKHGPNGEEYA